MGNILVLSDIKVQSDPVKYLAGTWGIDLFRGSGFSKLLGTTEGWYYSRAVAIGIYSGFKEIQGTKMGHF